MINAYWHHRLLKFETAVLSLGYLESDQRLLASQVIKESKGLDIADWIEDVINAYWHHRLLKQLFSLRKYLLDRDQRLLASQVIKVSTAFFIACDFP